VDIDKANQVNPADQGWLLVQGLDPTARHRPTSRKNRAKGHCRPPIADRAEWHDTTENVYEDGAKEDSCQRAWGRGRWLASGVWQII
jgi:hypothetical protein